MRTRRSCCMGCQDRRAGCHAGCPKYQAEWKKRLENYRRKDLFRAGYYGRQDTERVTKHYEKKGARG